MRRCPSLFKVFNIVALLSMLLGMLQPVLVTQADSQSLPNLQITSPAPPSDQAKAWPLPEMPDNQDDKIFLDDPLSQALEGALSGSSAAQLMGEGARLEPLTTHSPAGVELPSLSVPIPTLTDPLEKVNITVPQPEVNPLAASPAIADAASPMNWPEPDQIEAQNEPAAVGGSHNRKTTSATLSNSSSHVGETAPTQTIETGQQVEPVTNLRPATIGITSTTYLPMVMHNHTPGSTPAEDEVVITPGVGGIVRSTDGTVEAAFSPTSVQQETRVRYQASPASSPAPGLSLAGPAFSITGWEENTNIPVTQFPPEVTIISATGTVTGDDYIPAYADVTPSIVISMRYSDADTQGLDLRTLALYSRQDANDAWQREPSAVYQDQNLLVAHVDHLTEFAPMASADSTLLATQAVTMRVALDPDDDVGHADWPGIGTVTELPKNVALAQGVKAKLENDCQAVVTLTRDGNSPFVDRALRRDNALNFGADFFVTLAFNTFTGSPWGVESNGGVVGWARNGQPTDDALVTEVYGSIQEYTTRPHRRPVQHPSFYSEFNALPGDITYAHIETLFLDHNYDWPVINTGFDSVIDAVYAGLRRQLEAQGITCFVDINDPSQGVSPYPPPPGAAQIQKWRDLGHQNYQRYGADPVSFSTGNYVYQHTLFQMPGPGGQDVDFTLTHNAQDGRDSPFGFGWSFPYQTYTQVYSDNSVSITLHDGRTYHYDWNGSAYEAPAGVFDTLEQTAQGFEWTTPDGTVLVFEEIGHGLGVLTEWRDRRGNLLTFEHDLSNVSLTTTVQITMPIQHPPLTSMTDTAGRTITFESDTDSHITTATLPDGRTFSFAYTGGNLTEITDPNGGTRRFEYDDRHRIIKHWDPENIMYLENIYDDQDRVIEQVDASGSHMYLTYNDGETVFRDNLGNETRYFYDDLNRVTAVEDALGYQEAFVYDDEYNLTEYTDKRGHTWTYTYDDRGNRLAETDPLGHITTYTYNVTNDLTGMTDPLGRTTTFDYDGIGNLAKITRPDGTTIEATYDNQGQMLTQTDPNGHTTRYEYDQHGNLTGVTDPLGNVTEYEYDLTGRQTKMIDANGHTAEFGYDGNDNIVTITDPKGNESTFAYDLNDNLVRLVDRLGRVTTYQYDENLKLIAETNPAGDATSYDYDLMYNLIEKTDRQGNVTHYRYDALYQLTEVEDALGGVRRTEYDPNGNMAGRIDELGRATHFEYDDLNRLEQTTDALSGITAYEYDAVGNLTGETNPRGARTDYEYDLLDRLTLTRDALGGTWRLAYDNAGNLTGQTDANGQTTTYEYDAANRLTRQIDANGYETGFTYDGVGNQTSVTDALGRVTHYTYDENDNLVRITDALSGVTAFTYDAEDNLVSQTDANGRVTYHEYDVLDRVVRQIENYIAGASPTADVNVTTGYEYDKMGNLLRLTDANGNPTTFEYDALYRLVRETDAENQVTRYGYDAVDNLTGRTNPRGYETRFSYDDLNRLVRLTDAQGNVWGYAYDSVGNLIDATDPLNIVTHHQYDLLDRLTSTTQNFIPGAAATVDQNVTTRFEYDPVGNLRFSYDPRGIYQTEHRYDATNHRMMTIDAEGGETEFVYDPVYNLVKVIDGNNHQTTFDYDTLNRQVRITNPEGHSIQLDYDAVGNLLVLTDARGHATTFSYDGMYRLTLRVDALLGEWRYSYDPMGNLLGEIDANGHANNSYTYDKVYRLLSSTDAEGHVTRFSYDENGNRLTLTDGNNHTTTYTYDELDRLASITNAENETTRYQYDPLGNQTQLIEADGIVTLYTYDPLYRLVTVTQNYRPGEPENADTNVDTHYGYDQVGNLLTILDAEEHMTHFSYDGMNRLTREIDALGNQWDYEYDPVGNRTVRIDALRHRTEYRYYPDDQLQQITYYDGTAVTYTYDENNNRTSMQDHLGATTWSYDPLNRMTGQTDPFGHHLGYAYDAVGNRIGLTYADGRTVSYSYYDNDWLRTMVDPTGNVTVYDRDGVGQVTRILNPNNTSSDLSYDQADRLLTLRNYQVGGAGKTNSAFSYTYDEVGNRTRLVAEYAWRNPPVVTSNYTYDGLRRLIRDEDSEGRWTTYEFDRVGNRLTLTTNDDSLSPRPFDDKTLLYSYNDINQLLTVLSDTHPGQGSPKREDNTGQALYAFRHEVAAQRGKHISEAAADDLLTLAETLLADLESQSAPTDSDVTAAIESIRVQVRAYRVSGDIDRDGIENSLLVKLNKGDQANGGSSGDLQTITFSYDANGNRINKEFPGPQGPQVQGTDYAYDPENRLVLAQDYQENQQGNRVDRALTSLDYDGLGRRLVKVYDPKTGNGGQKRIEYVFDGLDPVAEYNTQNPQHDNYYRGDLGRIVSMHHLPGGTPGQIYWFHYDGLGSTSGLTKQNGQSSHNYRYEPYGQIELPPGNFTDPHNHYTFTGQELDENMGLYEFYARAYDYDTGTWVQPDAYRGDVNEPATLHRYGYVLNNPVNLVDPLGFSARDTNSAGFTPSSPQSPIDIPTISPPDPSTPSPAQPCPSPTCSPPPSLSAFTEISTKEKEIKINFAVYPALTAVGLTGVIKVQLNVGIENDTIYVSVSGGLEWNPFKVVPGLSKAKDYLKKLGIELEAEALGGISGKIEFNVCSREGTVKICGFIEGKIGLSFKADGVGVQGSASGEICLNLCNGKLEGSFNAKFYINVKLPFGFKWNSGGSYSRIHEFSPIRQAAILGKLGLCS